MQGHQNPWQTPETAPKDRPLLVQNGFHYGITRWDEKLGTWKTQYAPVWADDHEFFDPEEFLGWLELPAEFELMATAPSVTVLITNGLYEGLGLYDAARGIWRIAYFSDPEGDQLDLPPTGWAFLPEFPGLKGNVDPRTYEPINGAEFDFRCRLVGITVEEASAIFELEVGAIQEAIAENSMVDGEIAGLLSELERALDEDVSYIMSAAQDEYDEGPITLYRFRDAVQMSCASLLPPMAFGIHTQTVMRAAYCLSWMGRDVNFSYDTDDSDSGSNVLYTPRLFDVFKEDVAAETERVVRHRMSEGDVAPAAGMLH